MPDPTPTKIPPFVSVQFYPAYETSRVRASGRYVALGDDGRAYVLVVDGSARWELIGSNSYE